MEEEVDIIFVGSIMFDIMSYLPRMPKPGESLPGCRISTSFGGKGGNPAVAVARLGGKPAVFGKVGIDIYGQQGIENLQSYGVNTSCVFQTTSASSGTAVVMIEDSGENRIIVDAGANMLLSKEEVQSSEKLIQCTKVLVCNFETNLEAAKEAFILSRKHKVKTILNAAPAFPNPDEDFYTLPDVFCLNETEAEIITNMSVDDVGPEKIAAELNRRGCSKIALTLGAKGVFIYSRNENLSELITIPKVVPVDTTGAGDAFVGALAYYQAYFEMLPFSEQVRRAAFIASTSVQKKGTQTSYLLNT